MCKDVAIEGGVGKERGAVEVGEGDFGVADREVGGILERIVGADRAQ